MAEELQDHDKQNIEVASQLEKEREEAKKELDAIPHICHFFEKLHTSTAGVLVTNMRYA